MLAVAWLGEPVTASLLIAAALMAVGLFLHLAEQHEHPHDHAPLTHEHRHGAEDPAGEPHSHIHSHARLTHRHPHYPDLHHRHKH